MRLFCRQNELQNPEAARLRRKGSQLAACCCMLGAVPALTITHHHNVVAFVCIGVQIVLLCFALRFLSLARRVEAGPR